MRSDIDPRHSQSPKKKSVVKPWTNHELGALHLDIPSLTAISKGCKLEIFYAIIGGFFDNYAVRVTLQSGKRIE